MIIRSLVCVWNTLLVLKLKLFGDKSPDWIIRCGSYDYYCRHKPRVARLATERPTLVRTYLCCDTSHNATHWLNQTVRAVCKTTIAATIWQKHVLGWCTMAALIGVWSSSPPGARLSGCCSDHLSTSGLWLCLFYLFSCNALCNSLENQKGFQKASNWNCVFCSS